MFEQALLQEEVEQLVRKTRKLADLYDQLSEHCEDPTAKQQLSKLSREKHRNVELAERMREVLD